MAKQSLVIEFVTQTTDEGSLQIELDDERNKEHNNGRSSQFIYGDTVYFRVYAPSATVLSCYPSDGVIQVLGKHTSEIVDEIVKFSEPPVSAGGQIENMKASLQYPVSSGFSSVKISNDSLACGLVSVDPLDSSQVLATIPNPSVHVCKYNTEYSLFTLSKNSFPNGFPPAGSSLTVSDPYPIVVVVMGS